MKKLLLLIFLIGVGINVHAQQLSITSTTPAHGDVAVDTDTITVTFNKKIKLDEFVTGTEGPFVIFPEDSVSISAIGVSEDSLSMHLTVNLAANTDYSLMILDAVAADGDKLDAPSLVRFTTNTTAGGYTVTGTVDTQTLTKQSEEGFAGIIVGLTTEGLTADVNEDVNNGSEPDGFESVNVAFVDPQTGNYSIPFVREGDYFAVGFDMHLMDQPLQGYPEIYLHDEDQDFQLDSVIVSATTVTNDTLSSIDLRKVVIEPLALSEAEARTTGLNFGSDIHLLVGVSEFPLATQQQMPPMKMAFKGMNTEDPEFLFADISSGENLFWDMFFYDTTNDVVYEVIVTPISVQISDTVTAAQLEIPVEPSTMDALSYTIDSDSAAAIAEMNGGAAFRDMMGAESFGYAEMLVGDVYWEYPLGPDTTAPQYWRVAYYSMSGGFYQYKQPTSPTYDHNYDFQSDSLVFYIDANTGNILYKAGNKVEDGDPFKVTSSTPVNDSVGVGMQSSVVFNFDAPIRFNEDKYEFEGAEILVFPYSPYFLSEFDISNAGRTVTFYVQHEANTDYVWIVSRAKSSAGGDLAEPYVLNYSTSSTRAATTVSGTVTEPQAKATELPKSMLVALFTENPFADNEEEEHDQGPMKQRVDEMPEGPGFNIAVATLADPSTGSYTLNGVADGTYFPLSIDLLVDSFQETPSAIGIYDPDGDGALNSISVSGSNLTDIGLSMKDFVPVTASEAIQLSASTVQAVSANLDLYLMIGEEYLLDYKEDENHEHDHGPKKSIFKAQTETDMATAATGKAEFWDLVYYESSTSTAIRFNVNPFGVGSYDTLDVAMIEDDLDFPSDKSFSDLEALPSTMKDSDAIADSTEANGGAEFRVEGSPDFVALEYIAINAPWLVPEGISTTGPVWATIYQSEKYREDIQEHTYQDLLSVFDFVSGAFLGSVTENNDPILASEAKVYADEEAIAIQSDNQLYLIDAYATIYRNPELDNNDMYFKGTATESVSAGEQGKFYNFDFRYYSTTAGAETAISVSSDGRADYEEFPNPGSYFPTGVGYADLEPIPTAVIDSDSALTRAKEEGAQEFIDYLRWDFDLVRIDVHVALGNRFWELSEGADSSQVFWIVHLNKVTKNKETGHYEYEDANYLINAETSVLISEQLNVSNEREQADIPESTDLGQNYPNPFNPATTIPFSINKAGDVELTIYNMLGQKVATLLNGRISAGTHSVSWDASRFASGMYIYRLKANGVVKSKRLTLIK